MGWILPVAMGLGSLASGIFGSKQQKRSEADRLAFEREQFDWNKQFQQQQFAANQQGQWWNDWRSTWPTYTESSFRSNTEGQGGSRTDASSAPYITPEYADIAGMTKNLVSQRLQHPGLPPGFETTGIKDINRSFAGVNDAVSAALAQRGITGPAAAAGLRGTETTRGSALSDFLTTLPLRQRAEENNTIGIANDLVSRYGVGQKSTSATSWWNKESTYGASNSLVTPIPTDPNNPDLHLPTQTLPGSTTVGTQPGRGELPVPIYTKSGYIRGKEDSGFEHREQNRKPIAYQKDTTAAQNNDFLQGILSRMYQGNSGFSGGAGGVPTGYGGERFDPSAYQPMSPMFGGTPINFQTAGGLAPAQMPGGLNSMLAYMYGNGAFTPGGQAGASTIPNWMQSPYQYDWARG